MLTRVIQRKRPRQPALLVLGGAVVAAGLFAAVALAALVTDSGTHDLTVANKNNSTGLVDIGNAQVEYIGSSASNQASGTGLFDPFVRLQGSPTEKGYNTDGAVEFDTKTGTWTHAIKVNAIPVVDHGWRDGLLGAVRRHQRQQHGQAHLAERGRDLVHDQCEPRGLR